MKYLPIALLLLVALSSSGQDKKAKGEFNEEKNEVTIDGKHYINMEMKKSAVPLKKDFLVKDTKGDVLISFNFESVTKQVRDENGQWKDETSYRQFIMFPGSNSSCYMKADLLPGSGEKGVMKTMIQNQLIKDGGLDWDMTMLFIKANKGVVGSPEVAGPSSTLVVLKGNEIFQDDVLIGKVMNRPTETQNVYYVYDKNGAKILTAQIDKVDPFEWTLTPTEGKELTVMYDDDLDGVKILTYIASKGWLYK